MAKGTCFFITPIGEPDSPERIQADALRDNVLSFSCEPFDLEVLRADQIKGDSDINQDVVDLVRSAEVCVVDLTGLNANVMFEFGIRHQTSLPVIILAKRGTKLPFDVISRRTIFFEDIESANACSALIREIREYIRKFEIDGYRKNSSEPTLSEIYTLIETIDKKISEPTSVSTVNVINSAGNSSVDQLLSNLSPSEAFHFAYTTNQIKVAEEILDLLKDEPYKYYINKICALATKGSIKAMKVLEADLPEIITKDDFQLIVEAIGSLVTCYVKRDLGAEKISDMDPYFDQAYRIATSNRERAAILNQKQRMFAATKQFEEAKKLAEQMVQLYDEEPAYFFNYATILEELDDYDGAKEKIKKCVELSTNSESHEDTLMLACKLFKNSSIDNDKLFYNECLSKLEQINPYKARLLRFE